MRHQLESRNQQTKGLSKPQLQAALIKTLPLQSPTGATPQMELEVLQFWLKIESNDEGQKAHLDAGQSIDLREIEEREKKEKQEAEVLQKKERQEAEALEKAEKLAAEQRQGRRQVIA